MDCDLTRPLENVKKSKGIVDLNQQPNPGLVVGGRFGLTETEE